MGISIRPVESDEDYAAWRAVRIAGVPLERASTIEELRWMAGPQPLFVLAELDGDLAGSGTVGRSDLADSAFVAPRVLPGYRLRGVGSALLRALAGYPEGWGFTVVSANADDPGSVAFAERYGFQEVDRQVEQVRVISTEPPPRIPAGVTILPVSARPELWPATYETVGTQAFQDIATTDVVNVTPEQWEPDWITDPDA